MQTGQRLRVHHELFGGQVLRFYENRIELREVGQQLAELPVVDLLDSEICEADIEVRVLVGQKRLHLLLAEGLTLFRSAKLFDDDEGGHRVFEIVLELFLLVLLAVEKCVQRILFLNFWLLLRGGLNLQVQVVERSVLDLLLGARVNQERLLLMAIIDISALSEVQ